MLVAALLLGIPAPATAQSPAPAVHVIATGGTIASAGGGNLTGEALVTALPGVERIASVTVEQFSNVGSSSITPAHWLGLARRIGELFAERPTLAGVVITHGTDTMEETAYFLELTVADPRPVVVTGAMRPPSAIAAEGPANLHNAIRLAASGHPAARGALVLMNDEVFSPRTVTKTHTTRVDAFQAPEAGPLAVTDPDRIMLTALAGSPVTATVASGLPGSPMGTAAGAPARFDLAGVAELPRVDIVYSFAGADGTGIRAAADAGARGIVIATVGRGNMPPAQSVAAREAAERGVVVVLSSRTGAGRVPVGDRSRFDGLTAGQGAVFGAGDLNPPKARVLLMLALTRTRTAREIAALFEAP